MDSYTIRAPIIFIFTALMQFMHICCNSRTFFMVHEMSRFTRFGSQKKNCNLGFRAKKTEFPALPISVRHVQTFIHLQLHHGPNWGTKHLPVIKGSSSGMSQKKMAHSPAHTKVRIAELQKIQTQLAFCTMIPEIGGIDKKQKDGDDYCTIGR